MSTMYFFSLVISRHNRDVKIFWRRKKKSSLPEARVWRSLYILRTDVKGLCSCAVYRVHQIHKTIFHFMWKASTIHPSYKHNVQLIKNNHFNDEKCAEKTEWNRLITESSPLFRWIDFSVKLNERSYVGWWYHLPIHSLVPTTLPIESPVFFSPFSMLQKTLVFGFYVTVKMFMHAWHACYHFEFAWHNPGHQFQLFFFELLKFRSKYLSTVSAVGERVETRKG